MTMRIFNIESGEEIARKDEYTNIGKTNIFGKF